MIHDHNSGRLSSLDKQIVSFIPPGGNWRNLPVDLPSKRLEQIRRTAAQGLGSRSTYYGRLRWELPSYTISTYFSRPGNGCYIHPTASRLITIREAARLQSFPDAYRFYGPGRNRFIQVGNAVPPLLAYQIARCFPPGPTVDLFSGAGGLSLGFEWAGYDVKAAVDADKAANETFQKNRPHHDIALNVDLSDPVQHAKVMKEIRHRSGRDGIHLLSGGPPCQGFSTAGNCHLDDGRNYLVFAFIKAVESLRPQTVLMENVAALMWKGRKQTLNAIAKEIERLGYKVSIALLHAEGYGVPQLRRRVILIGVRKGTPRWPIPWRQILEPSSLNRQPRAPIETSLPQPFNVREAIGDLPSEEMELIPEGCPYEGRPHSDFQLWARGEIRIDELIPPSVISNSAFSGKT